MHTQQSIYLKVVVHALPFVYRMNIASAMNMVCVNKVTVNLTTEIHQIEGRRIRVLDSSRANLVFGKSRRKIDHVQRQMVALYAQKSTKSCIQILRMALQSRDFVLLGFSPGGGHRNREHETRSHLFVHSRKRIGCCLR